MPLIWHFCGETNTKRYIKMHERFIRFIYKDCDSGYKKISEYGQEIPQSHSEDQNKALKSHITLTDTRHKESNQIPLPHQDDCKTRKGTKYCIK